MAIQNETKMSSSERCRLIAEQMLAEARLAPTCTELRFRVARAWQDLAETLKQTDALIEARPRAVATSRLRTEPNEEAVDGATFIARWGKG
jgi:hypothetical protein